MNRPVKPLHAQLNLLLVNAPKTAVPDDKQRELVLALVELLIGVAQENERQLEDGGGDEREADR